MEQLKDADWEKLFHLAKEQKLSALCASALEETEEDSFPAPDILASFRKEMALSIRRTILFDQERQKLLSFLEESQIWYMPLKGIILKDMYPVFGTREMADNDILIDPEGAQKVREWFKSQGYIIKSYGNQKDDVYQKKPCFNFEIHRKIIEDSFKKWSLYYKNVKAMLQADNEGEYGYHFKDEDFFVFLLIHACKHLHRNGVGFRTLVDLYVYTERKPKLDWVYITKEFNKLGVYEDGYTMRSLASKLLSFEEARINELLPEEVEYLKALLRNGMYGTFNNRIHMRVLSFQKTEDKPGKKQARKRYLLFRLFPDNEEYRDTYPLFYKHWWGRILTFVL